MSRSHQDVAGHEGSNGAATSSNGRADGGRGMPSIAHLVSPNGRAEVTQMASVSSGLLGRPRRQNPVLTSTSSISPPSQSRCSKCGSSHQRNQIRLCVHPGKTRQSLPCPCVPLECSHIHPRPRPLPSQSKIQVESICYECETCVATRPAPSYIFLVDTLERYLCFEEYTVVHPYLHSKVLYPPG